MLDGASKTYAMTGWRLGWSVWPKSLYENARRLAVNSFSCTNAATQFAGIAALEGPQDAVRDMVAEFDKRRKIVVEGLNALPNVSAAVPKGLLRLPEHFEDGWKAKQLASTLLEEAGVATIGGPDFGVHGEGTSACPTPIRRTTSAKALGRMGEFLSSRKPA